MNKQQYETLRKPAEIVPTIDVQDALSYIPGDGTLLWGYTCDRNSFHVYLEGGQLHRVIYDHDRNVLDYIHGQTLDARLLHPNKRVYPEATSYDFIVALRNAGERPSLTTFNEKREDATWHGEVYQSLRDGDAK